MKRCALVLVLCAAGCTRPTTATLPDLTTSADAAEAPDLSGEVDLAMPDLATPDLAAPDLRMPDLRMPDLTAVDLSLGCVPVINEILTGTTAMDGNREEFVELYNPCPNDIDLTGWRLVYRASANPFPIDGADTYSLYEWTSGTIKSKGYVVLGGETYSGPKTADLIAGMYLANSAGGVGLRNPQARLADSVGYGMTQVAFVEGTPAPVPPVAFSPGRSLQRHPDGTDTYNNGADFVAGTGVTPLAPNP